MNHERFTIAWLFCFSLALAPFAKCTNEATLTAPEAEELSPAAIDFLNLIFDELESTKGRLVFNYQFFKDKPLTLPRDSRSRQMKAEFNAMHGPCVGLSDQETGKSYILYYYGTREHDGSITNDNLAPQAPLQFILFNKNDSGEVESQFFNTNSLGKFLQAHPGIKLLGRIQSNSLFMSKVGGFFMMLGGVLASGFSLYGASKDAELIRILPSGLLLTLAGLGALVSTPEAFAFAYNGFEEAFGALKAAQEKELTRNEASL